MAKKSAMSKGYRKPIEKKPYLSKRDITILCIALAVLAVAAILLFTYDDGAIKTKDGKLVDAGENWLVVNGSTNGHRYYKLAEVGELAGYTLEPTQLESDANLHSFKYNPADGNAPAISVTGTAAKPDRVASYYQSMFNAMTPTELSTGDIGGAQASWFSYQTIYYKDENAEPSEAPEGDAAADAEQPAPDHFDQAFHAYFPAVHDSTIGITVQYSPDSEEGFMTDDQLRDLAAQTYAALTLETR